MLTITKHGRGPAGQPGKSGGARRSPGHGYPSSWTPAAFAENAYLVKLRERCSRAAVAEIAKEIFRLADGCTSAEEGRPGEHGGFLALNDDDLAGPGRNS